MDAEPSILSLCQQSTTFAGLRLRELLVFMVLTQRPCDWLTVCRDLKRKTACELRVEQCRELFRLLQASASSAFPLLIQPSYEEDGGPNSRRESQVEPDPGEKAADTQEGRRAEECREADAGDASEDSVGDAPPSPPVVRGAKVVVKPLKSPGKTRRSDIRSFQIEQVALSIARNRHLLLMDRRNRFTTYKNCLLGCELIDWLVKTGTARTRGSAKSLGQCLLEQKIITHIRGDLVFKDAPSMYIFKVELFSNQLGKPSGMPSALLPVLPQPQLRRSTSSLDPNYFQHTQLPRRVSCDTKPKDIPMPPRRRGSSSCEHSPERRRGSREISPHRRRGSRDASPSADGTTVFCNETGSMLPLYFVGSLKKNFPRSLSALAFAETSSFGSQNKEPPSLHKLLSSTVAFHVSRFSPRSNTPPRILSTPPPTGPATTTTSCSSCSSSPTPASSSSSSSTSPCTLAPASTSSSSPCTPSNPPLPSPVTSPSPPPGTRVSSSSSLATVSSRSSLESELSPCPSSPSPPRSNAGPALPAENSLTSPSSTLTLHLDGRKLHYSPRIEGLGPLVKSPPPLQLSEAATSKIINRALYQALSMLSLADLAAASLCSKTWKELVSARFFLDQNFWCRLSERGFKQREKCWTHLAEGTVKLAETDALYKRLLSLDSHKYDNAIRVDVGRCGALPTSDCAASLFNVLRAYSIHDPQVGYCQGMMLLVSLLLTVLPQERFAFLLYKVMMVRLDVRSLYTKDFPRLTKCLSEFDRAVQHCLPSLHHVFKLHSIAVPLFSMEWFLTLFVSVCPVPIAMRLWDVFLVAGWDIFLKAGVAILKQSLSFLVPLPPNQLSMALYRIPSSPCFDPEALVDLALGISLPVLEG